MKLKTLFIHGILSLQSGILKSRALYNILIRSTNYALTSPGRCDIFGRKFTSRAELILTEPVPEVVKLFPADWAEKYFSAQSAMRSSRNSVAFLHQDGQTYERVKRLRTPENGRRESRWMYTH